MNTGATSEKIQQRKLLVLTTTFPRWKLDTIPSFVYELSKRLARRFAVSILTPNYPAAETDEIMEGMEVHRFRYFLRKYEKLAGGYGVLPTLKKNKLYYLLIPFFVVAEFFALRNEVKRRRPDVIHAHWIPQAFIGVLIKKLYGVSLVVTAHGSDVFGMRGAFSVTLKRFTLKNADKITVVSEALRKEVLMKIDHNLQIEVIPMGVDSTQFHPNKEDPSLREHYAIEGPFLLFVGRLSQEKGVRYLIQAMRQITQEFPKAKLLVVGKGMLEGELKQLTKELGLQGNVVFTGAIPNYLLSAYYATADVFVAPSVIAPGGFTEGLGLTIVEAGLSGCVPVASNIGGIPDVIKDGVSGFLVEQRNPRAIFEKVVTLLKDRSLADRMKQEGRCEILQKFDWEIVSARYEEVLNASLSEDASSGR